MWVNAAPAASASSDGSTGAFETRAATERAICSLLALP